MAEELGVEVSEVVEGGTALAFIAYPTAVTKEDISSMLLLKFIEWKHLVCLAIFLTVFNIFCLCS